MAKVGIIGLGIMGSAYAANLLKAGVAVEGADPAVAGREALELALWGLARVHESMLMAVNLASVQLEAFYGSCPVAFRRTHLFRPHSARGAASKCRSEVRRDDCLRRKNRLIVLHH